MERSAVRNAWKRHQNHEENGARKLHYRHLPAHQPRPSTTARLHVDYPGAHQSSTPKRSQMPLGPVTVTMWPPVLTNVTV